MPNITVSTDVDTLLQSTDKASIRTNAGLGATDTVSFGSFIPPSGTTAEINAVTNATAGAMMINTDTKDIVRFTSASTYETVSAANPKPILIKADSGAVGSTAGTAFKSGYYFDFLLDEVAAGEEKQFDFDIFFNLADDGSGNIASHSLRADLTLSADIGEVGVGANNFNSLPVEVDIKTNFMFYGPFVTVPAPTNNIAQGGIFGNTSQITGSGFPYNTKSNTITSVASSTGSNAQILSVRTFFTVRRTSVATYNFALPMRLSFSVTDSSGAGANTFQNSDIVINQLN